MTYISLNPVLLKEKNALSWRQKLGVVVMIIRAANIRKIIDKVQEVMGKFGRLLFD